MSSPRRSEVAAFFPSTSAAFQFFLGHALAGLAAGVPNRTPSDLVGQAMEIAEAAETQYWARHKSKSAASSED